MIAADGERPASSSRRRLAPILRGVRVVAARMRFLAVFGVILAVVGGWETIRSHVLRLVRTAAPESGISTETEYFCPMDPGVVADWPSKCPVCNMSLVLRERGDSGPLPDGVMARMQLTPYRLRLGGVATSTVDYRPLGRTLELPGRVVGGPQGRLQVEASAFVHELPWIESGQAAEVVPTADPAGVSIAGEVGEVHRPGADRHGTVVLEVAVVGPPEALRPGDRVRVRLRCPVDRLEPFRSLPDRPPAARPDEPGRVFACMTHPDVIRTSAGACPRDRSPLMARPLLENQRLRWWCPMHPEVTADRPGAECEPCGGMELVPRLISYRRPGTVLGVPSTAVIDDGARALVFVETGPGMFDARAVTLGPRCGDSFPVLSGLEPGERVVTQGAFLLDAETRLNPSLAAGYFGAGGAGGRPGRAPAASSSVPAGPGWLEGLPAADRPRAVAQGKCPVTGKALGSMGVPGKVDVKGLSVFICCEGCAPAVEADPEKYLARLRAGGGEAGR